MEAQRSANRQHNTYHQIKVASNQETQESLVNEQDIALRCQQGDNEGRRQLYETYAGWMLGVCFRYVGDRDKAKDLMHDGIVQVLDRIGSFQWRGEGSLKAWIFKVQQNIVLMYLRQHKRLEEEIPIDDAPDINEEPEPGNADDIPGKVIAEMIAELPVGYRTVFNMYVVDGLSHRQIAEMIGIKEKTSASQLVHARRILAGKINEWRRNNI